MSIRKTLSNTLKLNPAPSPWPRMLLCGLSVTLPLIAGILFNDQQSSIYGALLGFVLILNDHFGPLKQRVLHLLAAFFFLALAFVTGLLVSQTTWMLFPLLFLMAFMLGKSKGGGLELERLILFSTFQLLNAALTPGLREHASKLFMYASLSLINYLVCLSLVYLVLKHEPNFQRSKREEFVEALGNKEAQRYAFTLATVSCLGLLVANYFHVERAQWMVGTILIVMMPSKTLSYQRSFQRIFGTFIGVSISSLLTIFATDPYFIITFTAVAAFLAPLGLIRNYWLGNAFIAALIMFLLQFSHQGAGYLESEFAMLRIVDIGLGCLIGVFGTFIAFPHSMKELFKK